MDRVVTVKDKDSKGLFTPYLHRSSSIGKNTFGPSRMMLLCQ